MDFLKRSARISRLQKIPNIAIHAKLQAEETIIDQIENITTEMDRTPSQVEESCWTKELYHWAPEVGKNKKTVVILGLSNMDYKRNDYSLIISITILQLILFLVL